MDAGDAWIAEGADVPAQRLSGLTDVERVDRWQTGIFPLTVQLLGCGKADSDALLAIRHGDFVANLARRIQLLRRTQDVIVRHLFDVAVLGRGACGIV